MDSMKIRGVAPSLDYLADERMIEATSDNVLPCPDCGGDGGFESEPYSYDHHDGSPLTSWIRCRTCDGGDNAA